MQTISKLLQIFLLNSNFLLAHSEGMDDKQKTPRGHPNFNSYVNNWCVLVFQTDRWTETLIRGAFVTYWLLQVQLALRFIHVSLGGPLRKSLPKKTKMAGNLNFWSSRCSWKFSKHLFGEIEAPFCALKPILATRPCRQYCHPCSEFRSQIPDPSSNHFIPTSGTPRWRLWRCDFLISVALDGAKVSKPGQNCNKMWVFMCNTSR